MNHLASISSSSSWFSSSSSSSSLSSSSSTNTTNPNSNVFKVYWIRIHCWKPLGMPKQHGTIIRVVLGNTCDFNLAMRGRCVEVIVKCTYWKNLESWNTHPKSNDRIIFFIDCWRLKKKNKMVMKTANMESSPNYYTNLKKDKTCADFSYIGETQTHSIEGISDAKRFQQTCKSLELIGIKASSSSSNENESENGNQDLLHFISWMLQINRQTDDSIICR